MQNRRLMHTEESSMQIPFEQVDVFTSQPFAGNPPCVVPDGAGLSTEQMQAIAKEMNLSETTFVLPPTDPQATYWMRIFTPAKEIPFGRPPPAWAPPTCWRPPAGPLHGAHHADQPAGRHRHPAPGDRGGERQARSRRHDAGRALLRRHVCATGRRWPRPSGWTPPSSAMSPLPVQVGIHGARPPHGAAPRPGEHGAAAAQSGGFARRIAPRGLRRPRFLRLLSPDDDRRGSSSTPGCSPPRRASPRIRPRAPPPDRWAPTWRPMASLPYPRTAPASSSSRAWRWAAPARSGSR